ncbi:hypothetical protein [uncultured Fibrobacter sp.]|uniref:hypothetical protein n=1 Tax=uncultured Fibrobacter sp. TaxID=261512 RepID=UPI002805BE78|nr:hypothetical protein [uncultured Fibrobacter sp.]
MKSGWKPDKHPLRIYTEGCKRTSDDAEKRNVFVADSIADHVIKGLKPYGPFWI